MSPVHAAIEAGRCALAITESILLDADVMLALTERSALLPMALSGKPQAPVTGVQEAAVQRATGSAGGALVLVEPAANDTAALNKIAELASRGPHKPTIYVVASKFNPLQFMSLFKGLKVEQVKVKAKDFLTSLPIPPAIEAAPVAAAESAPKAAKKAADTGGVRFVFVGRDEEIEPLATALGEGGPFVISGPAGIGRTQLLEHAVEKAGLKRLPDLTLGRGVGADALFARLAEITRAGGSDLLAEKLKAPHTPSELVDATIAALKAASGNDDQVFVIRNLQSAAGREGDFFRKSRLELLCEALLTNSYGLRVVFVSAIQPIFYREGRDAGLRRIKVEGLKGRFYHDIFQAYGAPEFPRDKFGPLSERLHGNALAIRTAAVTIKADLAKLDDEKGLRLADAGDSDALKKLIEKRIDALPAPQRQLLANLAHLRYPVDGGLLAELGVTKKDRMALVAEGLLDMVGTEVARRYGIHPLVRAAMPPRETSVFSSHEHVAQKLIAAAGKAEGIEKLALQQEANRHVAESRAFQHWQDLEFFDHDAIVESCIGLIRSKTPRFDMAMARLEKVLAADPSNSDAHLLKLEVLRRTDAKADVALAALAAAIEAAPVPELFHEAVAFHLARNARGKAIKAIEAGVAALPDHTRLRTRLAALLLREGRRPEAIEHLRAAMDADPMLPDAYGLLGNARREEGAEKLEEAETLIREAVRLAPGDAVQTSRLIALLLDIARGVPERATAIREELRGLLDAMLQKDKKSWEAHLLYATAIREEDSDRGRARWFLKQARKLAPPSKSGAPVARIDLEEALLDLADGKLDDAEGRLQRLIKRDPSNHRLFGALASVLEARGSAFAAYAQLTQAANRTSPNSLDRQFYDLSLARLQALIQALPEGAEALTAPPAEEAPATDVSDESTPADEAAEDQAPMADEEGAEEPAVHEEAPSDDL